MYSVVLMMAITTGSDSADFGRRGCNACTGNNGCSGVVSGCTGGSSCHGGGGGLFGGHRNRGCNSCSGCVSVCHGSSSCNSCNGGGLFSRLHRNRCNGCNNSCHGVVVGCNGGHGCGGSTGCGGTVIIPGGGTGTPKTKEMPRTKELPKVKEITGTIPATIVVTLPVDAILSIDGTETRSTSDRRTFTTPALDVNSDYVYTLRAEVVREGRPVVETQTVTVRGGQVSNVPFSFNASSVASR